MDDVMIKLSKLDFCIQDVTLFLDTHPANREALAYYKEGIKHLNGLKDKVPGLTNRQGIGLDAYINEPFPWVKGENCRVAL